ncbi:hypothetical protein Tco_1562173 [Tanacetum coccineum]
MTRDRILEDYWRKVFNEAELKNEKKEDSEEYGESETNAILKIILEKGRKFKFLGIIYKEPSPILIEKIEVTRYNIGPGETYTKTKILGIDEIPRISTNVATVRAILMDEFGADGSTQGAT